MWLTLFVWYDSPNTLQLQTQKVELVYIRHVDTRYPINRTLIFLANQRHTHTNTRLCMRFRRFMKVFTTLNNVKCVALATPATHDHISQRFVCGIETRNDVLFYHNFPWAKVKRLCAVGFWCNNRAALIEPSRTGVENMFREKANHSEDAFHSEKVTQLHCYSNVAIPPPRNAGPNAGVKLCVLCRRRAMFKHFSVLQLKTKLNKITIQIHGQTNMLPIYERVCERNSQTKARPGKHTQEIRNIHIIHGVEQVDWVAFGFICASVRTFRERNFRYTATLHRWERCRTNEYTVFKHLVAWVTSITCWWFPRSRLEWLLLRRFH